MRRLSAPSRVPAGLDLDAALWWLVDQRASLDELMGYWEAHEDFGSMPDPREAGHAAT